MSKIQKRIQNSKSNQRLVVSSLALGLALALDLALALTLALTRTRGAKWVRSS